MEILEAAEAHAGEAKASRDAYLALSKYDQDSVIEFLKTLRLLPPGASSLFVDEDGHSKQWPPSWSYKFTAIQTSTGSPTLSGTDSGGGNLRMLLTWPGDSGLYSPPRLAQLQTASDLSGAPWINLGEPTAALSTEVEFGLEGNGFFRLLPVDE